MKIFLSLLILLMSHNSLAKENPIIVMDTSKGQITLELFANEAPKTVANLGQSSTGI